MSSYADQAYDAYLAAITNAGQRESIRWERLGNIYVLMGGGYVKIGYSTCPEARLQAFNKHVPFDLALVHQLPGTPKTESAVQAVLDRFRIKRDWFRNNGAVVDVIRGLKRVTMAEARAAFAKGTGLRRQDDRNRYLPVPVQELAMG